VGWRCWPDQHTGVFFSESAEAGIAADEKCRAPSLRNEVGQSGGVLLALERSAPAIANA